MDFNTLLLWYVGLSCSLILGQTIAQGGRDRQGWAVVAALILTVTLFLRFQVPARAGWWGGGLWLALIVIPLTGYGQVLKLTRQERYGQARQLMAGLRWLHPLDGWLEQMHLLRALELGQQGQIGQARQLLQQQQHRSVGQLATVLLYRLEASWDSLLLWVEANLPAQQRFRQHDLATFYLRALGETGQIEQLLLELDRFQPQAEKTNDYKSLNLARLYALAFTGRVTQAQALLSGPLAQTCAPASKQFWLATAKLAAGLPGAHQQLVQLQQEADFPLQRAITWRLDHTIPNLPLSPRANQILTGIAIDLQQEARYGIRAISGPRPWATYGLIGFNLLAFALELTYGGSENPTTLYNLGALVPELVSSGQGWRLLSATFLHFGWLHLSMNMLALLVIGPLVERPLGLGRYLLVYLVSGVGSMLIVAVQALWSHTPDVFVVGASGAIMGLIGTMVANLLVGWRREKARIAARRLRFLLFMIGLQIAFDLATPQISALGHAAGLVLGFLLASGLLWSQPPRPAA